MRIGCSATRSRSSDFIFALAAIAALPAFVHPGHIVIYAPGDSLSCRLALTTMASIKPHCLPLPP
ncbi:hypothetical protein CYD30_06710 [Kosakonia cowanii]|nr:hypothetical protein CYD30_06710 [Kosakonia cowanii]